MEEFSNNLYKRLLKLITSIERLNLIELWKFILSIVGWIAFPFLKVCLVGGVEKWEDRKWWDDRKVGK